MWAYLAGAATVAALALHAGGERVTQFGLKLAAFEASYDWQAAPRLPVVTAAAAPVPRGRR